MVLAQCTYIPFPKASVGRGYFKFCYVTTYYNMVA